MKKHIFCLILSVMAPALLFAGRSGGRVPAPQPVLADYFTRCVSGKGWRYVESHEIKANGDIEKRDYWDGLGGAPVEYFFTADTVTTYMDIDAYPLKGYRSRRFAFDGVGGRLTAGGSEVFRLISVNPDTLRIVKYQAIRGDGTPVYVYATYCSMSAQELDTCRREHRYNLDTFNSLYPALPVQQRLTKADFMSLAVGYGWKCTEVYKMETPWRYDAENCRGVLTNLVGEDYFISADSLTLYPRHALPRPGGAEKVKYTYLPNGFFVSTGLGTGFRVLSLCGDEMHILRRLPSAGGEQPVSLYCVYRRVGEKQ